MYNIEDTKMTPSAFIFLLFYTLLATVSGQQQSIVSTNTITPGGKFSIYCDASRATTPPGALNVQSLTIYRMVATDGNYSLIAQYNSLTPPGFPAGIRNIPNGRLWNITFSGGNSGVNNIATMKIVLDVNDAMLSDAGMYRCQIDYYTNVGTAHAAAPDQNVTASMSGQPSIVSTNTITPGGTFSVYCDASRVYTPPAAFSVQSLYIYRMVATDRNYSLIAQYNSLTPPGLTGEIRNIPNGRLWNIKLSGGNGGINNIATMKIVLDVKDAMLSDAGMYRCQIEYYTTTGTSTVTVPDQNVTVSMSGQPSIVSTNTINAGGTFSVYCDASRVYTPSGTYSVQSLLIYRMVATDRNYSLIAQYNSVSPPGLSREITNIPNGRLWNITFSGGNHGVNNIATMKIVLDVNDAMLSDAGTDRCQIWFYTTIGSSITVTAPDQNVTVLGLNVTASNASSGSSKTTDAS